VIYMSLQAMTWALDVTVGSATRKLVLWGLANHAHKDGRYAWCSNETLAEYAECDVRTVQRHLGALLAMGFIREGDQSILASAKVNDRPLAANKRPIVYDLAMSAATASAWSAEWSAGGAVGVRAASVAAGAKGADAAKRRTGGGVRPDKMSPLNDDKMSPLNDARGDIRGDIWGDTHVTQTKREPFLPYGKEPTTSSVHLHDDDHRVADAPPETRPDPRGTRLDPEWIPPVEVREWARQECPGVDLRIEHARFVDYWVGLAGAKARKTDWTRTWRNWMRKAYEDRSRERSGGGWESTTDRAMGWQALKGSPLLAVGGRA
jgi:Helix-turn-helix domain